MHRLCLDVWIASWVCNSQAEMPVLHTAPCCFSCLNKESFELIKKSAGELKKTGIKVNVWNINRDECSVMQTLSALVNMLLVAAWEEHSHSLLKSDKHRLFHIFKTRVHIAVLWGQKEVMGHVGRGSDSPVDERQAQLWDLKPFWPKVKCQHVYAVAAGNRLNIPTVEVVIHGEFREVGSKFWRGLTLS